MALSCDHRAERFGVNFTEPGKRADMALEAKRERSKREGFKTGMDIFSQVGMRQLHSPNG